MGLNATPESSRGYWGAIKDAMGLFGNTNKAQSALENVDYASQDEYESSMSETEIVELITAWKADYQTYYKAIDESQEKSFNYWIGKQKKDVNNPGSLGDSPDPDNLTDNLIFEAVETFLPIATRANPDPVVTSDPSDMGQTVAHAISAALIHEADVQKLRRKLARMTRHWSLYRLGVAKISWNTRTKSIKTDIINSRRLILDKDGYVDEGGYFIGQYLGEKKKETAEVLCEMFPRKKADITIKAKGKMATKIEYYEWWYKANDVFYTMDDTVLGKFKNPNWNYDIPEQEGQEATIGEDGQVIEDAIEYKPEVQGINHHKQRHYPYVFLSVFNVGLHPHDDTSLVLQNIPLQDDVNDTKRQISKNVKGMNNGMIVSGDYYTEEQAAQASSALARGITIRQPSGDVNRGAVRFPPGEIPASVFNKLNDDRNEIRNIFGTAGSTPEGLESQKTVRGKIMTQQSDSSRIGGGVTEQIEQVADTIYNFWAQFMFVFYDEEHFILASGMEGGSELVMVKNQMFPLLKALTVTVKEGSMVPKDPLTQRNEAMDLWSAGAIDPLNFFKRLEDPDPVQSTTQLILWQMLQKGVIQPQQYLPSFEIPQPQMQPGQASPGQMPPPQGVGGPAVNPLQGPQQGPAQQPGQGEPVAQQEHQLIQSVPIK